MKKLTEIYGLSEGPFDDINRQLGSAQSVAGQPRGKSQGNPQFKKAQDDLNASRSVAKREATGDETMNLPLTADQCEALKRALQPSKSDPDIREILKQVEVISQNKPTTGGTSSSMSMGRAVGGLKLQ